MILHAKLTEASPGSILSLYRVICVRESQPRVQVLAELGLESYPRCSLSVCLPQGQRPGRSWVPSSWPIAGVTRALPTLGWVLQQVFLPLGRLCPDLDSNGMAEVFLKAEEAQLPPH